MLLGCHYQRILLSGTLEWDISPEGSFPCLRLPGGKALHIMTIHDCHLHPSSLIFPFGFYYGKATLIIAQCYFGRSSRAGESLTLFHLNNLG